MGYTFLNRKHGWSQVGSGCFAIVTEHSNMTDRVLKITKLSDTMKCVFCTFVESKHICFPVIHKYKEFRNSKGQEFASIVLERLEPINDWGSKIVGVNRIAKDYAYGTTVSYIIAQAQEAAANHGNRMVCSCSDPDCYIDIDDEDMDDAMRAEMFCYANLYNLKYRPKLIEAVDILKTAFEKADVYTGWDLHEENVMRRGQVPVITDPCT